ncbi:MAG: GYF domain-containing protein [Kofleriaceae bacterium]
MKIVCDACQAKYSISDDKVQGKVFKIRCKKCSNIIVVRGGAGASEPAPAAQEKDTRVYDYGYDAASGESAPAGDDAVWHLVINQDQVGPMTVAEVQQRFASGEVDGETFAWREGFADWLPLSQVDAFAGLIQSGSTTTAGGGGAAAIGAMFGSGGDEAGGTTRSDPGDLFAAASGTSSSRSHEDDDGGDLFGSKPAASAASSSAAASANSKLRGERNENSVLFSLNNLAQLASDKPAISAPSSQSSGGAGHATGAAGGEGSGLIDIRSMASAYMGSSGSALGKPQTASAIGSIDDLPVFGGGGFSEPAVLVPTVRAGGNNKIMYLMIGAVSLLAVVAIVMVVILMKNKGGDAKKTDQVATTDTGSNKPDVAPDKTTGSAAVATDTPKTDTSATPSGSAAAAAAPDTTAKTDTTTTAPAKTDTAATVAKADTAKTPAKTTSTPAKTTSTPAKTSSVSSSTPAKTAKTETPAAPTTTAKADAGGGGCDEVSCVLNNYEGTCCAKFKKGGKAPAGGGGGGGGAKPAAGGGGDLPDGLDRSMISAGISNVKARVTGCGDKSSAKGKVKVHVKVGGDGKVANVSVESSPDAALGSCVQAAVSKATFAKTQSGGSFSYPFVF